MKASTAKALVKGVTVKFLAKEAVQGAVLSAALVIAGNAWRIYKGEMLMEDVANGVLPEEMEEIIVEEPKKKFRLFKKKSA